jgi:pimeloyl-ACP methyl ester carboxylesterase
MERAALDGLTLEYEASGVGEPVVLIHGSLIADAFRPLLAQPGLAGRYRLIGYRRRGYAGSSGPPGPVSVAQQAADCLALLRHLGVERAHFAGHSFGGAIALQLALDTPGLVHSLAVLEPAGIAGASAQARRESPAQREQRVQRDQRYREAGAAPVVDEFLRARWPGYRAELDRVLPGAFEQAVADAGALFELESPALRDWHFGEAEARRITQPVLVVLGAESEALSPRYGETYRSLLAWLPQAEGHILAGAAHGQQLQNPRGMAEALAAFYARYPIPT